MYFRIRFLLALGSLGFFSAASTWGQQVAAAFAYKMEGYSQTPAGGPTRSGSFIMGGFRLAEPQVASARLAASLTLGANSLGAYGLSDDGLTLSAQSPEYATRAALDGNYPNGAVGFRFGEPLTWEGSLELTGDRYPGAPRVTNLASLQALAGGSATIEWQPGAGALPDDTVVVSVSWRGGDLLFTSGAGAVGRTTIPVPSGREAVATITALRTTARGEAAGAELAVGYGASTVFRVRSTGAVDTTPPRVTAVSPALDTVGVSPTARVQVTFDDTMRPIGLLRGGAEPQGRRQRVTWSEDQKTATFEFPTPLPAGPVELSFSSETSGLQAFRDLEGNFLAPGTVLTRFFVGNLPVFVQQPVSSWPALGASVTLNASANWPGGGLTYQWLLNGVAVPGATNPTLTLNNFDLSRAGLYELRVTNAHGSVLSAPALISTDPSSRLPRAGIAASQEVPLNYNAEPITPGLPLTLSLRTANGVTAHYWRKNGQRIAGATGLNLSFASLAESDTGIYDAVLTNAAGTANTEPFTLVVKPGRPLPTYTLSRQTLSVFRGDSTTLALHATVPFGFQRGWQRDGVWIEQGGSQSTLSLSNVQQGGVYRFVVSNGLETVVAAEYTLTLRERGGEAPYIVDQTSDVWFTEGGAALLSMTMQGALPMTYQWKLDGVALPGRNGSVLVITQDPPAPTGIYTCVITNARGSVETGPMTARFVTSRAAPPKPRIGREGGGPASLVLGAGRSLSLRSDLPSNVPPVTRMQWRLNGNPLPNGGSSTLHVSNLTPQHSGAYTLVCGNSFGETESDPFTLRVVGLDEPPYRDREKVSLRVAVGDRITLTAPFAQGPDLRYRWLLNGRDVTAENSIGIEPPGNFYVLNAQATHAGAWTVEAANAAGTTTAAVADVVVEPGPPASARLVNVSTRASAGQGSATLIAGFTLSGTGPKRLLLRA
ncbi:MAG TPA: Ig-like domain-containing protein, partial [Opitutaceae bacterium]